MFNHIPRRSGQERCGAQHPHTDMTCTGRVRYEDVETGSVVASLMGLPAEPKRIIHRGKHRARILTGIVVRWDDNEASA